MSVHIFCCHLKQSDYLVTGLRIKISCRYCFVSTINILWLFTQLSSICGQNKSKAAHCPSCFSLLQNYRHYSSIYSTSFGSPLTKYPSSVLYIGCPSTSITCVTSFSVNAAAPLTASLSHEGAFLILMLPLNTPSDLSCDPDRWHAVNGVCDHFFSFRNFFRRCRSDLISVSIVCRRVSVCICVQRAFRYSVGHCCLLLFLIFLIGFCIGLLLLIGLICAVGCLLLLNCVCGCLWLLCCLFFIFPEVFLPLRQIHRIRLLSVSLLPSLLHPVSCMVCFFFVECFAHEVFHRASSLFRCDVSCVYISILLALCAVNIDVIPQCAVRCFCASAHADFCVLLDARI